MYDYLSGYLPPKRKVFISYHHGNDQTYYDYLSSYFSSQLELFRDNSLQRAEISDDADYLDRKIREEFIYGTSITIVLFGAETPNRKFVDWEIYSTLEYEHALLGIILPTTVRDFNGNISVPDRFHDNYLTGYTHHINWTNDYQTLSSAIETAISNSSDKSKIDNSRLKMRRNT